MTDNRILTVTDLKKRFTPKGAWVADGISFSLDRGDILGIAGPSGCGKTTLIRMIAGFERPDSGTLELKANGVGMVFQDHALFPHLTAAQNASFGLQKMSKADRQTRTSEILSLCRLEGLDARYPRELSGGQQQRLALARALAPGPELLLMDEPFNTLDPNTKDELLVDIRRILKDTGTTVIVISHEIKEAFTLADRLLVLNHGKVQAEGSPEDLYLRPKDQFMAAFLGPINLLHCPKRGTGMFRPEQAELLTKVSLDLPHLCQAAEGRDWIYLRAKVLDRRFLGPWQEVRAAHHECHCALQSELSWETGNDLVLRLGHHHVVRVGDDVQLRVHQNDLRFFP